MKHALLERVLIVGSLDSFRIEHSVTFSFIWLLITNQTLWYNICGRYHSIDYYWRNSL